MSIIVTQNDSFDKILCIVVVAVALDIFSSLLFNLNIKRMWILYIF